MSVIKEAMDTIFKRFGDDHDNLNELVISINKRFKAGDKDLEKTIKVISNRFAEDKKAIEELIKVNNRQVKVITDLTNRLKDLELETYLLRDGKEDE